MARPDFRWCAAHAIGHHVLHVGTSFYLQNWQWANHTKAERQAEEFAAWLACGPGGWSGATSDLGIPADKFLLVQTLTSRRLAPP